MRMEPKYVKRRQRGAAVILASLVLLIGSMVHIGVSFLTSDVSDYKGTGNGVVQLVTIQEGATISELGPELEQRNIVASDKVFQTAAYANPNAGNIKPGVYRLQEEMSATSAVAALLDPANLVEALAIAGGATLMDVKVVAGEVRTGIYSQISNVTCNEGSVNCVSVEDLQHVAANTDPRKLGVPEWAIANVEARGNDPRRLEGLIVPGEYVVDPESDAEAILTDLITRSATAFAETDIEARAQAIGLSPYELLVAASLVEREAPAGDFDKVARVILNRLHKPMKLEFDSTVNYDLTDVEVATTDEDRARQTPWNTYAKEGLPETPIAAASVTAVEAMENPAEGNWLFFVTVDKQGTTIFTDTYDQHLKAVDDSINNGVLDSNR